MALARPPDDTTSTPPLLINVTKVTPPLSTNCEPPLRTVVLSASPPDSTDIVSPALKMMPVLVTPELTT